MLWSKIFTFLTNNWQMTNRCAIETLKQSWSLFHWNTSHMWDCGQVSLIVCQCNDLAFAPLCVMLGLEVTRVTQVCVFMWRTTCLCVSRNESMHVVCSYRWHNTEWLISHVPSVFSMLWSQCVLSLDLKGIVYPKIKTTHLNSYLQCYLSISVFLVWDSNFF